LQTHSRNSSGVLSIMFTSRTNSSVHFPHKQAYTEYKANHVNLVTATGEEQAPIKNTIGAAIVDAVLRAAKEGRKFRVICVIPAIPGFPGDLRDAAAAGTRAIIDYQYKSICRGEHSIMSRIEAAGVDPKKYIFFFNLRSYDRLHKSKELEEKEAAAGIPYSEIQRAHAADVMGEEGVTGGRGWDDTSSESSVDEDAGAQYTSELRARKERFERSGKKAKKNLKEHDSIAANAMLNERQVSDEVWEGDEASERQNFVNEELYVHAKVYYGATPNLLCSL
jgi:phospholipase D1/2